MKNRLINLFWICFEQGIRVIGSLVITILVVNHLGAEKFGAFSLSLAILTTLGPIVGLGFDAILFKRFISDKEMTPKLLGVSLLLRLCVSSLVIALVTLLNLFSNELYVSLLNVFVIGFLFDSFLAYKDFFLATLKNKFYTYSTLIGTISQLILVYICIELKLSPEYIALTYVISKALIALALNLFYRKLSNSSALPIFDWAFSICLLKQSYPMMLAASIGLLYSLQDQYFIKYLLNDHELGIYAVGVKFIVILVVLPTLISNVFYPSLVKKYNENRPKYLTQLRAIYALFFTIGIVLFFFMLIISKPLISMFFGEEFISSVQVMKVYALVLVLSFFQSINNKILVLHNLQHLIFKRATLALFINALLNYYLIPVYGIVGAAYSTVLSEVIVLISYSINKKTRFIFYNQIRAMIFVDLFNPKIMKSIRE